MTDNFCRHWVGYKNPCEVRKVAPTLCAPSSKRSTTRFGQWHMGGMGACTWAGDTSPYADCNTKPRPSP